MADQSNHLHRWISASLLLVTLAGLAGCSEQNSEPEATAMPDPQPAAATPVAALTPEQMAQWSRSCALCHVRGEGGAPVLGDREAWAERWQQGESTLLEHTVTGLNNMPPLGYCMDCEEADFMALIRFMGEAR